jgi:hypothetical protein
MRARIRITQMRVGILMAVVGCAYQPGSFSIVGAPFSGPHVALGCIDLSVDRRPDVSPPIVRYMFANGCNHRVTLDLATVRVVGRDHDGHQLAMTAYDPHHEIRPLPLGARLVSDERIEYHATDERPIDSVCIDVGGVDGSVARTERWVCP